MIKIGDYNKLRIVKSVDFGVYLDGGDEFGEILLPKQYMPVNSKIDDEIEVFIYLDSEDRFVATTEKPLAKVGDFAILKVKDVNNVGAFLDIGLMKDLLVPFKEQKKKMEVDKSYLVYIYVDYETDRLVGSSKLDKFLDNVPAHYTEGEEIDLIIYESTDLGYKAIINNTHIGLLYKNEVFKKLYIGDNLKGYIKKLREDEKIDLSLQKERMGEVDSVSKLIIDKLKESNSFIPINDKSSPEEIYSTFEVSKKLFKKSVGTLYRLRKIKFEGDGIRLVN